MKVLNHIRYAYDYPRLFSNILLSISNTGTTTDIPYVLIWLIFLGAVSIYFVRYFAKRAKKPYLANSGEIMMFTCFSVGVVLIFLMVVLMFG